MGTLVSSLFGSGAGAAATGAATTGTAATTGLAATATTGAMTTGTAAATGGLMDAFMGGAEAATLATPTAEALTGSFGSEIAYATEVGEMSGFMAGAKEAAFGLGEFAGGISHGVSSAFRGVGDIDPLTGEQGYKMGWGEAIGSQVASEMINYQSPTLGSPGSAPLGSYGGRPGAGFNSTAYLTSGYNSDNPLSYISSFSNKLQ